MGSTCARPPGGGPRARRQGAQGALLEKVCSPPASPPPQGTGRCLTSPPRLLTRLLTRVLRRQRRTADGARSVSSCLGTSRRLRG